MLCTPFGVSSPADLANCCGNCSWLGVREFKTESRLQAQFDEKITGCWYTHVVRDISMHVQASSCSSWLELQSASL